MSGYAIFNIEIKKPEEYKEYVEKVKPLAEKFGGDYLWIQRMFLPELKFPWKVYFLWCSGMPRITQQASYFPIISQLETTYIPHESQYHKTHNSLIETWFKRKMIPNMHPSLHGTSRIPTNWNIINAKASNAHLSFFTSRELAMSLPIASE